MKLTFLNWRALFLHSKCKIQSYLFFGPSATIYMFLSSIRSYNRILRSQRWRWSSIWTGIPIMPWIPHNYTWIITAVINSHDLKPFTCEFNKKFFLLLSLCLSWSWIPTFGARFEVWRHKAKLDFEFWSQNFVFHKYSVNF